MAPKVLLTGGSGFIAAHILSQLLKHPSQPTVITTVRSQSKADPILSTYASEVSSGRLIVSLVPDISSPTAFDAIVKESSPLDIVIHTASPFHFQINDPKVDLVDPAVNGTTGILNAIAKLDNEDHRKSVKRVVITSSFAAILDEQKIADPNTVFSEKSWNPVTLEEIHRSSATAYRASKTLAEKAAWEFVGNETKKNGAVFDLVTINPPMVFGPVIHDLGEKKLAGINTSNQRVVDLLQGKWKDAIPDAGPGMLFVDVRDVAAAHVKAAFDEGAGGEKLSGKRLFATAGLYSNKEIAEVVRRQFDEYKDRLPEEGKDVGGDLLPEEKRFKFDNSETTRLLGIEWIGLEKSIGDTVRSLKAYGA
ncbi:hypothetical protein V8F20_004911 [Naviculisporaceae sp. PSN 640]